MIKKHLKILLCADTHLGFDFPLHTKLKIRRRGPDFFNNFYRILAYAEQSRPDFLIHGGDLFFRSRVAPSVVDMAYKALFDFVNKTGIPIYIVPGNHERSHLPQSLYLAHPLIHIFNHPRYFYFKKDDIMITLHGFPFYRGAIRDQFKDLLRQSGWNSTGAQLQLLVLHQAVDGAQVGPSDYTFRNRKDVIDIRDIPNSALAVLCGHIHRQQVLYSDNVPVIYPGSIERTSFAEKDEAKGFYEIEFSQNSNHSQKWIMEKTEFRQLPARPMSDIYLNSQLTKSEIKNWIANQCAVLPRDSIIRLRMQPDQGDYPRISSSFIRSIIPSSFNLQMGMEFHNKPGNKSLSYASLKSRLVM